MRMAPRVAVSVAAGALTVAMSHPVLGAAPDTLRPASATPPPQLQTAAVEVPKLTVRLTPLVRLTRGDARGLVVVPRHGSNRVLQVILESENYYSVSDVQLDGDDAPQSHSFYWRDLPPGSYRVTVHVYGTDGLRGSTSIGSPESISQER
jgi:hypothetical protein